MSINNYEVHSQEELDDVLSKGKEALRYSIIELYPWKYKLEKIPFDHIAFVRPIQQLKEDIRFAYDFPEHEQVELGTIDCPEWTTFTNLYLCGGELQLKHFTHIVDCFLTEVAIDRGTFSQCIIEKGRLNIMNTQKYEWLGAKHLPFIQSCSLRKCVIGDANIYFDWGGFNMLQDISTSGELKTIDGPKLKDIMYLDGNNLKRNTQGGEI